MEQVESVQAETHDLSSGVEESQEETTSNDLREVDAESYDDSTDLSSLSDEEFEELSNSIFNPKKPEPQEVDTQEEVESAEPPPAQPAAATPQLEQGQQMESFADAETDPQLRETLSEVGRSYQGLEEQEKTLIQRVHALQTRANELAEDNPREAVKFDLQAQELQRQYQEIQSQKQSLQVFAANLSTVPKRVPTEYLKPEPMIQELQDSHGMTYQQAEQYVKNMMYTRPANEIISVATQAMYGQALRKLLPEYKAMKEQLAQMQGKSVKPQKSQDAVAKLINKARSIPKQLTPVPTQSEEVEVDLNELAEMSNEQFEQLTKQVLRNGKI